jgi:hypothetical protein
MSVLDNFETWKGFLSNKLQEATEKGIGQQVTSNIAVEVGNYLSENVEAKNEEEALLRDLWNSASSEEQQAIANIMIKLVQKKGN